MQDANQLTVSEPVLRKYPADRVATNNRRVLIINTGGTIGMEPSETGSLGVKSNFLASMINRLDELNHPNMPLVSLCSMDPLIDSASISPDDWIYFARTIQKYYDGYDGFVVTHGTDTMSYTAAALSFALENLAKPVVLTGAQLPLGHPYTDGRQNLASAIFLAGYELVIPEVCIFFNRHLHRGNRCIKENSWSLDAFGSPNFSPLASLGISVTVNKGLVRRIPDPVASPLRVFTRFDRSVVVIRLVPGFSDDLLMLLLESSSQASSPELLGAGKTRGSVVTNDADVTDATDVGSPDAGSGATEGLACSAPPPLEGRARLHPARGIVIQTYGTGNMSSRRTDFIHAVTKAIDSGVVVVITSQCVRGEVRLDSYDTGEQLKKAGCVSAGDMTTDTAAVKLSYLLGQAGLTPNDIRTQMEADLRGEISSRLDRNISDPRGTPAYLKPHLPAAATASSFVLRGAGADLPPSLSIGHHSQF
ncbi:hypothetical protein, variant [Fonticula alba]|uniref:asparaginase n=1 Tax=Fonticula alba TaxID=691883 RepID=A0A058Z8W7_FONAL|nr:hypothetical protein H696_03067 [Fonticula alba]XP_009495231.1 hypothetical protein, variant [Fonticula alba]KCV70714.1 hypothetical protein H696_03067 [Fonticula alba]KCV70715.1 hypothetical protein, variant [Fonticula alba]|eukprot:XP_009495230.1 hypothetical protein H696_03067 [Fonticula alba]